MPFGSQALAEEVWPSVMTGLKATATLTYTDTGMGTTVTKKYKPAVSNFKISRGYAADESDHRTTVTLADTLGDLSITASTFGTGIPTGLKTEVIGVWNKDQEDADYPPFSFSDTLNGISMDNAAMISVSSQGTYTENLKDTTIVTSIKYTIMGTVTVAATGDTFPAKLVVQLTGSKLLKVAP